MLTVTHEPRVAAHADRTVFVRDGVDDAGDDSDAGDGAALGPSVTSTRRLTRSPAGWRAQP